MYHLVLAVGEPCLLPVVAVAVSVVLPLMCLGILPPSISVPLARRLPPRRLRRRRGGRRRGRRSGGRDKQSCRSESFSSAHEFSQGRTQDFGLRGA